MKKNNFLKRITAVALTGSVALLITGVVVVNGCKKDTKVESEPNANIDKLKTSSMMTAEDSLFSRKIVLFDGIMENYKTIPNYSINKQLNIDSAVWYMEAWFNAKYAFPNYQYTKTESKTDSLVVNINLNNNISMDNLAVTRASITNKIIDMLSKCTLNNKELILVNFAIHQISKAEAAILITPVFGELGALSVGYDPFGIDDYWHYGEMLGDCDLNEFEDTDAAHQISEAIMSNRAIYMPCSGCYYSYSDIDTVSLIGDEYLNSNSEFLIFYIVSQTGSFTPDETCLDPDEMNLYFHNEEEVIYDNLEISLGKSFMSCEMEGKLDTDEYGQARIRHRNELYFGVRHLVKPGWISVEHLEY